MAQDPQSEVSDSSKALFVSYVEGASAFPNSLNPASVALAEFTRASSFISRHAGQPPYLLTPRLRQ
jgi:hypothetical protein